MNSILRKAMLPAAVAVAMAGFIGAFGGSTPAAHAIDGDICAVYTDANDDILDGFGNDVLLVDHGETYGLVFRIEDEVGENVEVRIDSETGSARITSKAEVVDFAEDDRNSGTVAVPVWHDVANVAHILVQPAAGTQVVDTISPRYINDADGHELDDIGEWLKDVGYSDFVGSSGDDTSVCGGSADDGWGFIDFECIQPGYFHIDILTPDDTEETGHTVKFFCGGQAESATIAASPTTVEIVPVGNSLGLSTVTVTVLDQDGKRLDGAKVTFTTNKCRFNSGADISPAGGGTTVTTFSDSDTTSDTNFLANNPLQSSAGTAEAVLNCTGSTVTPGTATVTAIVDRPGSDIVLTVDVKVIGQTSATGLSLVLTPDDLECGETILAVATAVDALGANVSDGTVIHFTTDTSTGIQGGAEGAQGQVLSVGGKASVLIATDPSKPGIHTVIAYTVNAAGSVNAQTSETYVCDGAVAPAAPTVAPPATGTGSITPPNTGDAGLAAGSTSSSLFVLFGAVAFVVAGLASIRFARN